MARTSARPVLVVMTGMGEYQSRLIAGMRAVLSEYSIPMIAACDEPFGAEEGPSPLLLDLIRRRVPIGVIALASASDDQGDALRGELVRQNLPNVRIGDGDPRTPSVRGDSVSGMVRMMTHLLDERCSRRPVLVRGIVHQPDSVIREQVFRGELCKRGLPIDEELVLDGAFRQDIAYAVVRELLGIRRDMDAVVALNDDSALGAMGALIDEGMNVPREVAVSGFDNVEAAALTWPGLTTVDQNLEDQGAAAARLLLDALGYQPGEQPGRAGDQPTDTPGPTSLVIPSRLVVRASTSPEKNRVLGSLNDRNDHAVTDGAQLMDGIWMVDLDRVNEEFATAIRMGRSARHWLISQDAMMGVNRAMMRCRTVAEVASVLTSRMNRLGIKRCFLGLHEDSEPTIGHPPLTNATKLALAYRWGRAEQPPAEVFEHHQLLPRALRSELSSGLLTLQPLSVADREIGYLLFEAIGGAATLTELLRIDVGRALDTVMSTRRLQDHTATLERLVAERTQQLESVNQELQKSLMRDGLTQIANKLAFQQHIEAWCDARSRYQGQLSLLMLDVDMFKAYNDCYGHLQGDETLRKVASCLAKGVRELDDLASRFGGEEFAVVLPGAGMPGALAVAKRVRALLASEAVPHSTSTVSPVVTVSIGIAVAEAGCCTDPESIISSADAALYQAKLQGRDCVRVAGALSRAKSIHT